MGLGPNFSTCSGFLASQLMGWFGSGHTKGSREQQLWWCSGYRTGRRNHGLTSRVDSDRRDVAW